MSAVRFSMLSGNAQLFSRGAMVCNDGVLIKARGTSRSEKLDERDELANVRAKRRAAGE